MGHDLPEVRSDEWRRGAVLHELPRDADFQVPEMRAHANAWRTMRSVRDEFRRVLGELPGDEDGGRAACRARPGSGRSQQGANDCDCAVRRGNQPFAVFSSATPQQILWAATLAVNDRLCRASGAPCHSERSELRQRSLPATGPPRRAGRNLAFFFAFVEEL